ncbi:reverse transcriptase domain-containing protein [Tanacetum coccineum]
MNSTKASSSYPSKKIKLTIIPPRQLFVNISSDEDVTTTPSPTTTSSSPTLPNAPSKNLSTNQTSSSSNEPTSLQLLSPLLDNILDVPPRPSNPQPLQSHPSLDITLSLSPITPLDHIHDTPSPPSPPQPQPPIMGHPLYYNYHEYHGSTYICCLHNRTLFLTLRDEMNIMFVHLEYLLTTEMLRNCHGHNLSKGNIIKIFYHGLNKITQEVLNAAAGGFFLYKIPNQTYQLLEDKVLLKLDWAKNKKTKSSLKKTVAFADEGNSNSDTDTIMARMDAMTIKIDAQYKELQSRAKQPTPDLEDDDIPISGKSYDPPINPNDQQNNYENPINFDSDDEDDEPTPQLKTQPIKPVKETPLPKPYKPMIPYPQRLRKEKMEAQYGKFIDMIRAVRINVPLIDVLTEMPNYGKFLKELINNKHKIEQISAAFLSDESLAMIQNKVPPKLGDPGSFLIPCNFKTFSCNAIADLGASINLKPYSLYAKLSLETLKTTKMSVRLADRSFQYPVGIAENMLIEVGKFTFPAVFVILKMEEDSKVSLILGRLFLHTADAVIRVKQN